MKNIFSIIVFTISVTAWAQEVKMRDIFAQAPDSIFPLMTKNNKLDCIDFLSRTT